jgi:YYY domain-containing protein
MANWFGWYLLVSLLGWVCFPLAWRLFPALADRGYSLSRSLALLLWGYLFWMGGSLGILNNDGAGLLLTALVVAGLSAVSLWRSGGPAALFDWLKANRRMLLTVELLFGLAFAFLAFVRAGNPEILGTEKPMELAFINAILRSPSFPPHDPWLSGYAISYYYFGYVMAAMLARATSTLGSVAFNLMLSLVFALAATGAYGIVYDLLAVREKKKAGNLLHSATGLPLLGPLFLLIVSNFEGFFEVLYARRWFWSVDQDGALVSPFWKWLDLQDLNQVPSLAVSWMPQRYYWWWRASRVINETNLAGVWNEIIDEFPFFSFLLGDLHPHVLAIPFGLLVVAVALNLFLGGWKGETNLGPVRLPVAPLALGFGALALGGLAFLNTWDILPGFALLAGAFLIGQVRAGGWSWKRVEELLAFGLPLGLAAILLYLPFYLGFASQAGGPAPNLENPTRGIQLWIMFGPLFLPILAYLVFLWRREKLPASWGRGLLLGVGFTLFLWLLAAILGLVALRVMPELIQGYLQNMSLSAGDYFSQSAMRRFERIGTLVTLLALLVPAIAFLVHANASARRQEEDTAVIDLSAQESERDPRPAYFALLLILFGALLVLGPEFVYLRDQFANRMNTIFKFYYQAWMLFSLASAYGVAVLLRSLRPAPQFIFRVGLFLVLFLALIYPVQGLLTKTQEFQFPAFTQAYRAARAAGEPQALRKALRVWSLDGGSFARTSFPDEMALADWLRSAPVGVLAEAMRPDASYRYELGLVSTYSGLPIVLGWPGHEGQWRGSYEPQGTRLDDIRILYETYDWLEAQAILEKYDIRYVLVGSMERQTYRVNELKFQQHLNLIQQSGSASLYEVP